MAGEPAPETVSVALLTRNGGPVLERLLEAVRGQETLRDVDIVALDSGSRDGTRDALARAGARVESILAGQFSFGPARDRVFEMAAGQIVISLSQDAVPTHALWLEHLIAPLVEDESVAAACGRSLPDPERGYPQFLWERAGLFYFTREMARFRRRYGQGLSNANSAIRRAVWQQHRFGDQPVGEDFAFQARVATTGWRVAFPEDAPVLHHHNYTVPTLWRRCRNEGLGLRVLGMPYNELDLLYDLVAPRNWVAWFRHTLRGNMSNMAEALFPIVRPLAVYAGSRFGCGCVW